MPGTNQITYFTLQAKITDQKLLLRKLQELFEGQGDFFLVGQGECFCMVPRTFAEATESFHGIESHAGDCELKYWDMFLPNENV